MKRADEIAEELALAASDMMANHCEATEESMRDALESWKRWKTRAAAVDYWAITTNISSNAAHAYKDGKAICGSPLQAGRQRWDSPGCIGCKKCVKIWIQLIRENKAIAKD